MRNLFRCIFLITLATCSLVTGGPTTTPAKTHSRARQQTAAYQIKAMQGEVRRDDTNPDLPIVAVDYNGTDVDDSGLVPVEVLDQLQELNLWGTQVSDAGLAHLKDLPDLRVVILGTTKIGDAGLEQLKGITSLRDLALDHTQVTDAGLEKLTGLKQLRWLHLEQTKVTAAGVKKFQEALPDCKIVGP